MRFLFILSFLFFSICSYSQNTQKGQKRINKKIYKIAPPTVKKLKEPVDLTEQIETFINQINKGRKSNEILYVIKVYNYDTISHDYCFSMSYILNSHEYNTIKLTHYFMIGNDAVVLNASNPDIESIFSKCSIKAIGKEDVDMLINHLIPYPNSALYEPSGMTYCKREKNIINTYYPFKIGMPMGSQIEFSNLPREFPGLQLPPLNQTIKIEHPIQLTP